MNVYDYPLCSRYASDKMKYIFSPDFKFSTWRKLWVYLAQSEKELGLDFITNEQIDAMKSNISNIDYEVANMYEKKLKHDVMAHVHTFADLVPIAKPIIHLGATSAYVGDNTDLIQIKQALLLTKSRILNVIKSLRDFSMNNRKIATLAYTHFQAAQLTTVGKRATLWLKSLMYDLQELDIRIENLEFRGVKGTTGTQASFKELFNGDYSKVKELDILVSKKAGFSKRQEVSGQTYDRKQDSFILQTLASIASTAHKFTNDFRLLQHLKEMEEPFSKNQIGSSAMAYKRNPMKCERISALSKFVISNELNGHLVHSTQWFERTLDDSANKRLSYPQSFLAIDSILILWHNIISDAVVYEKMIEANLKKELPFMATENIIMRAVKNGMDRQVVHEIIRQLSMEETKSIKLDGNPNKLIDRILKDGRLKIDEKELTDILDANKYIGFAVEQVEDYIKVVDIVLEKNKEFMLDIKNEEVLI
ncbi:adenylosuccinate lyase [Oceanivirga salmonicida]|uniref:adenylosuccinate lyase n=1 Tax=Oceanivirga salmonicida TaxID=1769291 RepID=UPI00082E65A2|nr:adenylosuccinate lyase [Oceanivirga salmonicida]